MARTCTVQHSSIPSRHGQIRVKRATRRNCIFYPAAGSFDVERRRRIRTLPGPLLRRIDRRTESMAMSLPDDVVRAMKGSPGANGDGAAAGLARTGTRHVMTFRKLAAESAGKLIRAYFTENTPQPDHDFRTDPGSGWTAAAGSPRTTQGETAGRPGGPISLPMRRKRWASIPNHAQGCRSRPAVRGQARRYGRGLVGA